MSGIYDYFINLEERGSGGGQARERERGERRGREEFDASKARFRGVCACIRCGGSP